MTRAKILLLALFCLLPGAAFAQHADTMLPDMCRIMCASSLRVCDKGAAPDDPACLTRRIVCAQTCKPCLAGREECGRNGGDFSACLSDYGACSRSMTDEKAVSHPLVAFRGGDGASKAEAVVIAGAQGADEIAIAENTWRAIRHSDWQAKGQSQSRADGRVYDVVEFATPKGAAQIWFDIGADR